MWCECGESHELVAGTYDNSVNEKRVLHHRRVRRMTQIEITLRSRYFSRPPARIHKFAETRSSVKIVIQTFNFKDPPYDKCRNANQDYGESR